ncbi:MAG: CoA transferase [Chloroflexi bacterium]|nr:CoA transferase [Chloroflexota bacterium]
MTRENEPLGPLAGIRVVDLARGGAQIAGRILADLGAEVIAVEPPGGAPERRWPPFAEGREESPEGSLYWAAMSLGKRSVVLDLGVQADRGRVLTLLQSADVLIESFPPGALDALGLGYDDVSRRAPGLVYTSITPYGQTGPDAMSPSTDLTVEAAGGLVGLQGDNDRPPVPVGFPQASFHAGAQAAADTIIALNERERSGLGQHLDVSMQAAIVWTLMNATGYPPATGADQPRTGAGRADPPVEVVPGVTGTTLWECADGYVQCILFLGVLGGATLDRLMRHAESEGFVGPSLHGIDWRLWLADVQEGRLEAATARQAMDVVAAFIKRRTKRELLTLALNETLLLAPIYTIADVLADEHLRERGYWQERQGRTTPGLFARLTRTPVRLGEAVPAIGEGQALLETGRSPWMGEGHGGERRLTFDGLKVADFAWVGVGPITSKAFADHGATVVHVETASRPDILRMVPPFKDGIPGIDRSQFMANFNSSKLGLALNLATPEGRTLARRLIDWADVVVESFTPGTMQRWGLDYAAISRERPDLVMLSTCLRGQTGPERAYGGFGGQGAALAGLHGITGWPDRAPVGTWGAYTDFIAPRYAVSALASALYHRARTGLGQHIDLSQIEAAIHFIEPLVLDYTVNGRMAGPAGHNSLYACPHGVYRTAGVERYVAIAVETAEQWQALRSVAPLDEFAADSLSELSARRSCHKAIDRALKAWALDQDPWELAARLKEAGVPASVVLRPSDLYEDQQLAHRRFFVPLEHAVMGRMPYDGPVTLFSATPGGPRGAGPGLGEHSHEVLTELLGLTEEQVAEYAVAGALA